MAPVGVHNFNIRLLDTAKPGTALLSTIMPPPGGGFSECHGLESAMQVEEYREGGRNDGVLKFPGRIAGANIRLKRGLGISDDLWKWHEGYLRGEGKRRDGVIELRDDEGDVVATWRFRRGIPIRWVGPTFVAAQSAVAVEELEIAHEGLKVQSLGVVGELASTLGAIGESLGEAVMDVHIGEVQSDVLPVEDRGRLEGAELDHIVEAVLAELQRRRGGQEQARHETLLWGSVRAGGSP